MKTASILFLIMFLSSTAYCYFQQDVRYTIDVSLDAENKTYSGRETIFYRNNSDSTLSFIWLHLYPNAYKEETTPFARQQETSLSATFINLSQDERGWLELSSVTTGSVELKRSFKEDAIDEIRILLNRPLLPGDSLEMHLEFRGKFPKLISRMGYAGDNYFAATQWYPKVVVFDQFGWHPDSYLDMGEFYGEFADFDVRITLPANFVIDATGLRDNDPAEAAFMDSLVAATDSLVLLPTNKARKRFIKDWKKDRRAGTDFLKTKTVRFRAHNVHDFAWFCGDLFSVFRKVHNDGILTYVLINPEDAYKWREVPRFVEQTIRFYSDMVGPYEYPKASVVGGSLFKGGGMEYPMITAISGGFNQSWTHLLENVVMHEVGHNWFYGMLGSDERASAFLDEGVNSFVEYKYMEYYHGRGNLTDFDKIFIGRLGIEDVGSWHLIQLLYGSLVSQGLDQPLNLRAEQFTSGSYSGVNYQKGAALLLALEWYMGEQHFSRAFKEYFHRWRGKHPTKDDFFAVMQEYAPTDLSNFIHEWYNTTHYCDFTISDVQTVRSGHDYSTTVFVKNRGTMSGMAAPVQLITSAGDTLSGRWSGDPAVPVGFKHGSKARSIRVNPDNLIFETNYLNNGGFPKFDLELIADVPKWDAYAIHFYPYYWYEYFKDKNRIGAAYWSGNFINKQWNSRGSFYYGSASGKWGYEFRLSHRFHGWIGNFNDAAFEFYDKEGLQRYSADWQISLRDRDDLRHKGSLALNFDYVHTHDLTYLDPAVYQDARYATAALKWTNTIRRLRHSFTSSIMIEQGLKLKNNMDADFTRISLSANYARALGRSSKIQTHLFAGAISSSQLPAQEAFFAAGETDPRQHRFVPNRRGALAPLRGWAFEQGAQMFGYNQPQSPFFAGKAVVALGTDVKIKWLPIVYCNAAVLSSSPAGLSVKDRFAEAGIKLKSSGLTFILPVYISDPAPGEKHLAWRMLTNFQLRLVF